MKAISSYAEVRLNQEQVDDTWAIYHRTPNIQVARDAFASIVFCAPFTVTTKSLALQESDEVRVLIEQHWLKWQNDVYDWLKMYGICPYYLERVGRTVHRYPVVPPFGTGYITTYVKVKANKQKQAFKWYWNGHGNPTVQQAMGYDKDVEFIIGHHAPTIQGQLTSPVSTLIDDYRALRIVREAMETATHQAARPVHLFEHHPPKNGTVDNHLVSLEFGGERAAGAMLEQVEAMQQRKAQIKTSDLVQSLLESALHNKRLNGLTPSGPFKELSQDRRRAMDMENPGLYSRSFPLRADYKYVQAASPKILTDFQKLEKHVDTKAASVMDFPLELIQPSSSARGASNVQGNLRYINEQIKSTLKFFARITKHVFIQAYGSVLQAQMNQFTYLNRRTFKSDEAMMHLYVESEVVVEMQCNPIMSVSDIQQLHMMGIMSKRTMAEHAFAQYAIPETQISLSEWPDMVPKEMLARGGGGTPKREAPSKDADPLKPASPDGPEAKKKKIKAISD